MVLLDALSDSSPAIRSAAAEALGELTGCTYGTDLNRWRSWWEQHQHLSPERWLEQRLAYQATRAHRLEEDLERTRAQVVRLHQQLYSRLPAVDRLAFVQTLVEQEDVAVRGLAVAWSVELLPAADSLGQKALVDTLLRLSGDGSGDVQRAAALALGRVNDTRALERLRSLLAQAPTPVRAAAARASRNRSAVPSPKPPCVSTGRWLAAEGPG